MKLLIDEGGLTIYQGEAADYNGPAPDLILTNPYGPMPAWTGTPALLHQWVYRQGELEHWSGRRNLRLVATWNDGREAFWASDIAAPQPVELADLRPEPGGWYPEALVGRILDVYGWPSMTIWDGFMGRGTIAKVARDRGMRYIGVERLADHLRLAQEYLQLPRLPIEG